jgi:hypothetical protein
MRPLLIVAAILMLCVSPTEAAAPLLPNHKFVPWSELVHNGKVYDGQTIMSMGKLETKRMFVVDQISHYKDVAYLAEPNDNAALFHFDDGVCVQTLESTKSGTLARLVGMTVGVSGIYHHVPTAQFPAQCHNGIIEVGLIFFKTDAD